MAETVDESVEPIKQKICILKASIHCEGCKRKVKKLLNQVQGVEFVDVDIKQQKVTVTGNVDADTLVKKLVKSGKKAEIWPQKAEKSEKTHGNGKSKEKEIESQRKIDQPEANSNSVSDNAKSPEISTKSEVTVKFVEGIGGPVKGDDAGGSARSNDGSCGRAGPSKRVNGASMKETKSEGKKSEENCTAVVEPPPAAVEKSNGGGGMSGKKKKKKGQSGNFAAPSGGVAPPEQRESRNQEPDPLPPTNHSPPRGHHYPPPHSFYTPPPTQPAYAVSYNTAYPTSSYTASYYAAPPPYAHAYMHQGPVTQPTPSDNYYTAPSPYDPDMNPRQPLDSFEIFSDENPNGCFVM